MKDPKSIAICILFGALACIAFDRFHQWKGGLKNLKGRSVSELRSFEFEGANTKVFSAGDCLVFATKWKSNENPNFYFACNK